MRKPICDTRFHGATTQRKSEHLAVRMVSNFLCASWREDVYLRSTCATSALKAPGAHFNPGLSEKIERDWQVQLMSQMCRKNILARRSQKIKDARFESSTGKYFCLMI
jgi:hypothetical protein